MSTNRIPSSPADPLWDCLTNTSARDNSGWFKNEGTFFEPITEAGPHARFAGHAWLEYADQLVDFSVGDWREHSTNCGKGCQTNTGRSTGQHRRYRNSFGLTQVP